MWYKPEVSKYMRSSVCSLCVLSVTKLCPKAASQYFCSSRLSWPDPFLPCGPPDSLLPPHSCPPDHSFCLSTPSVPFCPGLVAAPQLWASLWPALASSGSCSGPSPVSLTLSFFPQSRYLFCTRFHRTSAIFLLLLTRPTSAHQPFGSGSQGFPGEGCQAS